MRFNGGTPFASEWCVRHIRDCDYSTLSPQSTYIRMPSALPGPVELNHPESSESCETFLCYHFGLVDSHRKHVLRVTGGEIRSRSAFLCGLFQTGQGQVPLVVVHTYIRPMHSIFIVPLCSALPVAHGCRTPDLFLRFLPQHVLSRQTCKLHGVSRLR